MRALRLRFAPVAVGVAVVGLGGLTGCPKYNPDGDCQRICQRLTACGLLPSPLGGGDDPQANCLDRCRLTDPATFDEIAMCGSKHPDAEASSFEELWCGEGDTACRLTASCLTQTFPGSGVLGRSTADVTVAEEAAADGGAQAAEEPGDSTCQAPAMLVEAASRELCAQLGIQTLTVALHQLSPPPPLTVACADQLPEPIHFGNLMPGPTQPEIQVRWVAPAAAVDGGVSSAAAGTAVCRAFFGPRVVLRAGQRTVLSVALPTTLATLSSTGHDCQSGTTGTTNVMADGATPEAGD